jgi:hypothetical protein
MGKGSKRRLEQVPAEQIQKNWDKIFGKAEDKKNYGGRKNSINSRKRTKSTD